MVGWDDLQYYLDQGYSWFLIRGYDQTWFDHAPKGWMVDNFAHYPDIEWWPMRHPPLKWEEDIDYTYRYQPVEWERKEGPYGRT